jgi:hypothetical protein
MDIEGIKRLNKEAGHFFFSPNSMRFFKSRILSSVEEVPTGWMFITSERFETLPRHYTMRICYRDGSIKTVGQEAAYSSARQARRAMREIAKAANS